MSFFGIGSDHELETWDRLIGGEEQDGGYSYPRPTKICNKCGTSQLSWRRKEGKWKLYDEHINGFHICKK